MREPTPGTCQSRRCGAGPPAGPAFVLLLAVCTVHAQTPPVTWPGDTADIVVTAGYPCTLSAAVRTGLDETALRLFFRMGGERSFVEEARQVAAASDTAAFVVPGPFVTSRGLEVQLQFQNGAVDTTTAALPVQVSVPVLRAPEPLVPDVYRMVSVPLESDNRTIADLLEDDLGTYDVTQWRGYWWERATDTFTECSVTDTLPTGDVLWVHTRDHNAILDIDSARSVSYQQSTRPLYSGWQAIANPYPFAVDWSDVLDAIPLHRNQTLGPYWWNGTDWENPLDHPQLLPWTGYYVQNSITSTFDFVIPALESPDVYIPFLKPSVNSWCAGISVTHDGRTESNDYFGTTSDTVGIAHPQPPEAPGATALNGAFVDQHNTLLMTDIRPSASGPGSWHYRLTGLTPGHRVDLAFAGRQTPLSALLELADPVTGHTTSIGENRGYSFTPDFGETSRDLFLSSGPSAVHTPITPQHRPPIGIAYAAGAATITYVPHAQPTTPLAATIRSLDGRIVRVLPLRQTPQGALVACWDRRARTGTPCANGIYVCSIRTPSAMHTITLQTHR